jgi:hypothetical protein
MCRFLSRNLALEAVATRDIPAGEEISISCAYSSPKPFSLGLIPSCRHTDRYAIELQGKWTGILGI